MQVKKFFIILAIFSGLNTFGADHIELFGQIINIDNHKKTITIQEAQRNITVQVFPNTKLHGKNCGMFGSFSANESFSSLKSGMFVEVKGYSKDEIFNAYRIKWQCNTAY
ncbi:hypothetical protein [uncultured Helicobacter sp.]|uniref:hypothetical protein n=1 Tax=uncultured Helicobacter sp. TaxID=175537 RepID=UPI00261181E1|nr:hypothetical protein [uncultured Helicobacter sp.]